MATTRMHRLISELYENMFDHEGNPIDNPAKVVNMLASVRQQLLLEMDMVKEACSQAYEEKYGDISGEEGLFLFDR